MTQGKRSVGRPRKRVLSRALIFETALRLLDERGPAGGSMRDIAGELGVRPSALYNHVSGRDDIIAGIRELITDRMDVSVFDTHPFDEALELWAHSYLASFAAHPPTIALLAVTPLHQGTRSSEFYDTVLDAFLAAGWPEHLAMSRMVALECFILGAALDAHAPGDMLDPGPRDDVPALTRAFAAQQSNAARQGIEPAQDTFRAGIRTFIRGLRVELDELAARADGAGGDSAEDDGALSVEQHPVFGEPHHGAA